MLFINYLSRYVITVKLTLASRTKGARIGLNFKFNRTRGETAIKHSTRNLYIMYNTLLFFFVNSKYYLKNKLLYINIIKMEKSEVKNTFYLIYSQFMAKITKLNLFLVNAMFFRPLALFS